MNSNLTFAFAPLTNRIWKRIAFSEKAIAGFFFLLLFTFLQSEVHAQTPAANISGPLKAAAKGSNITLVSNVVSADPRPQLNYTFDSNTSGATIVSTSPYSFDPVTGEGRQTVTINPGPNKGSFNIRLNIVDRFGTGESSKSVTITAAP